jgi:alkylation response protein AidB-like acyl-CoA dehydrogenase
MIILCRSERKEKHGGLTYFIVPIKDALGKGVEVRPLIKMTGGTGFNEVFFTDLEIPDTYRLDEVGKGWQVAMTTLMHERGAGPLVTPAAGGRRTESSELTGNAMALIDLAKSSLRGGKAAADDPLIRDRIMSLVIRQQGFSQALRRTRVKGLIDHPLRIPQQGKLVITELMQDIAALSLEIEGPASTLFVADSNAPAKGEWPLAYLNSYGMTIAAGTSEVIRNILGERVLGLPKSK